MCAGVVSLSTSHTGGVGLSLPCASEQKREGHAWIVSLSMSHSLRFARAEARIVCAGVVSLSTSHIGGVGLSLPHASEQKHEGHPWIVSLSKPIHVISLGFDRASEQKH